MILTITQDRAGMIVFSKDERFLKFNPHGNFRLRDVYEDLCGIAEWVNDELGEECLYEMD